VDNRKVTSLKLASDSTCMGFAVFLKAKYLVDEKGNNLEINKLQ